MAPSSKPVAIVTGASRGIGRAIAVRLAQDGYAAVVNFHSNRQAADEAVGEIEAAGGRAIAVQADIGATADRARIVEEALKQFASDPACQVFLSTDAGGTGLNLQNADTVVNGNRTLSMHSTLVQFDMLGNLVVPTTPTPPASISSGSYVMVLTTERVLYTTVSLPAMVVWATMGRLSAQATRR